VVSVNITGDMTVYAVWGYDVNNNGTPDVFEDIPKPPVTKDYYLTATAESGSTISPSNVTIVHRGNDQAYYFSAMDGYRISAVLIDGVNLSQAQVDLGYYIFKNVMMNHSIDVKAVPANTGLTLSIDILGGKGHAQYSINGKPFVEYTGVVSIPELSDIVVRAYADTGYFFAKWEMPASSTTSEITFGKVESSLHLSLYFSTGDVLNGNKKGDHDFPWWILVLIILLIIICLILWFLRRSYDVVKVGHTATIVGKDRVHRKSEYTFRIEGGAEKVSYRVGDGEEDIWKPILPNKDGEYVIPKGEITGKVFIEQR
jgi:hypothetical protein